MRRALLLATVVVPIYTALLHAWIYAQRRRRASGSRSRRSAAERRRR
jgi:hypothetical protein